MSQKMLKLLLINQILTTTLEIKCAHSHNQMFIYTKVKYLAYKKFIANPCCVYPLIP